MSRGLPLILVSAFVLSLTVPCQPAAADELQDLVAAWLRQDCDTGDERSLRDQLIADAPGLEPLFLAAYRSGPSADELEQFKRGLGRQYRDRAAWLKKDGTRLFGAERQAKLLAISEQEYVARQVENLLHRHRSRSLAALGLTGDERTARFLDPISRDTDHPDRLAALTALQILKERLRRP